MTTLKDTPMRIPDSWDATWFRQFVVEVLDKGDYRNATTVSVSDSITDHNIDPLSHGQAFTIHNIDLDAHANVIDAHQAETDPHPDLIDDLPAVSTVSETDLVLVSQGGVNKQATVNQLAVGVFGEEWDDMLTVGTGINPPGAASDPLRSTTTGLLEFSGTADNVIVGEWQMSHQWKPGIVRPHIHLRFPTSTATNSRWKFEYDVASVNDDFINNSGTLTTLSTITIPNPENVKKHCIQGFGDLDLTGYRESAVILWRITRLANSDAADNYTGVVELLSVDLHYQKNKAGTEEEYPT